MQEDCWLSGSRYARRLFVLRVMGCKKTVGPRVMECEMTVGPRVMECEKTDGPRAMECE